MLNEKVNLKRLYTVWIYLYNILDKIIGTENKLVVAWEQERVVGRKEAQERCGDKNSSVSFWGFVFFLPHWGSCGISVPQPGIWTRAPAVEAQNPNHWIAREFPQYLNQSDGSMNLYMWYKCKDNKNTWTCAYTDTKMSTCKNGWNMITG